MSHDHHPPVEVDPAAIIRSEQGWQVFTKYGKYGTVAVITVLVLMAIFLL